MDTAFDIIWRAVLAVVIIIALTRLNGLRSFSKMSSFDFALTVAMGSILAGAITSVSTSFWVYAGGLAAVFAVQACVSLLRTYWKWPERLVDNDPVLLMEHGEIFEENLKRVKMTRADLFGKLREANALDMSLVRAAVFEPTGDVSILHLSAPDATFDEKLLDGVLRDPLPFPLR